jgi:molybdate transport system substrate-binding protein
MKRILFALLLLLVACGPATATAPRTLTVFAAASLTDAFTEIGQAFETDHPGVTVKLNFAGSQSLRTQLEQGAVADVFASANRKEMDTLISDNLVVSSAPQDFLTNSLIIVLPRGNPANVQTPADLAMPGLKLVLADESVPAGKYARQVLNNLNAVYGSDFKDKVLANVVSNENDVKQVVAKVQLGEADAGIVYLSDSVAAPDLETVPIPEAYNVIAAYPIATLTAAHQPDLAAEFVAYVFSPAGQAILQKWGFTPINP